MELSENMEAITCNAGIYISRCLCVMGIGDAASNRWQQLRLTTNECKTVLIVRMLHSNAVDLGCKGICLLIWKQWAIFADASL